MAYSETDRVYDELLLTLMRSGDRAAGERLAARWQPRLLRTARRLLRDPEQAREAVQEAWTGICRGWRGVRDPAKFPAWAYRILHHKCSDRIRFEQANRARTTPLEVAPEPSAPPHAPLLHEIDQAFEQLNPNHREVAIFYFAEGLTLTEISTVLKIPLGTAKSRVFHARKHLKSLLEGVSYD